MDKEQAKEAQLKQTNCPKCGEPTFNLRTHKCKENIGEEIAEIILEVRQYLCNTEFAPEPFRKPTELGWQKKFVQQILALFDEKEIRKQERERIIKMLEVYDLGEWVRAQDFVNRFIQALKQGA